MPTYHIETMEGRAIEQATKRGAEITCVSTAILGGASDSMDMVVTGATCESPATGGTLQAQCS